MHHYKIVLIIFYLLPSVFSNPFDKYDLIHKLCVLIGTDETTMLLNQTRYSVRGIDQIVTALERKPPSLEEVQTRYNETAVRLADVVENLPAPVQRLAQMYYMNPDTVGKCYLKQTLSISDPTKLIRIDCEDVIISLLNLICSVAETLAVYRAISANTEREVMERREVLIDRIRTELNKFSAIQLTYFGMPRDKFIKVPDFFPNNFD